jgi:prepilin-type N-terminal cleavage/methylation domain-containing protein
MNEESRRILMEATMKEAQMMRARAFTLVEILIVVVLLGILAAIVIPALAGGATLARQSTLAMNLSLLRRYIPVYASQHLELAPGYPDGDRSAAPTEQAFIDQGTLSSNMYGQTAARGTAGFPLGPYVSNIPPNPFNKLATVQVLGNGDGFPAAGDDSFGWIYKPATGEIRPGNSGTDQSGRRYYDY